LTAVGALGNIKRMGARGQPGDDDLAADSVEDTAVTRPLGAPAGLRVMHGLDDDTHEEPAVFRGTTDPDITPTFDQASDTNDDKVPPDVRPPPHTNARLYAAGDLATIYVERAMQRQAEGDTAGAIADYTKALERSPAHSLAAYNRGVAWLALGRPEAALADFRRVLDLVPQLPEAHYNLALAELALGDRAGAARRASRVKQMFAERGDLAMVENAQRLMEQALSAE
jgi:tetratricopeptide (TPR) repeat protein